MTKLFKGSSADADSEGLRLGGQPLAPEPFTWPTCRSCTGAMQFQFQVPLESAGRPGQALLAFQCQNKPGLCDEWSPAGGGNVALVVERAGARAVAAPPLPPQPPGRKRAPNPLVIEALSILPEGDESERIGSLGGSPEWIQHDETPSCTCGKPMAFVAEIDEAAHRMFNFGMGGRAYVFVCEACADKAAFLWQR